MYVFATENLEPKNQISCILICVTFVPNIVLGTYEGNMR